MIYEFGPDGDLFTASAAARSLGIANMVWLCWPLALVFGFIFASRAWGRHVYAVGGNEQAARLAGVPVNRIKLQTTFSRASRRPSPPIMWSAGWAPPPMRIGTGL